MAMPDVSTNSKLAFVGRRLLAVMDGRLRRHINDPDTIVRRTGLAPGQRVLEIGCGSGYFTPALAAQVGQDGGVVAIDVQPLAVAATSEKVRRLGLANVQVRVADAHRTDFPAASFDAVALYGVVPGPGIIDEPKLAREILRLLRPGGLLAIWTAIPFWRPRVFANAGLVASARAGSVHRLFKPHEAGR
jgi:ubiquinone/menaquinone biosynthesis C-methylase UbiE